MYANPAYQLTRALEQLEARKIIISDNITAAAKVFDKVVASTPEEPPVTALRDAVLAGADPTAVGAALLYQMGANQLSSAWQQAATEAAYRALAVIMDERETLHAQLKAQAGELIEKLGRLATIDVPLDTLIREGKTAQVMSIMQTAKKEGMTLLNEELARFVKEDLVDPAEAYSKAVDKEGFMKSLEGVGVQFKPPVAD